MPSNDIQRTHFDLQREMDIRDARDRVVEAAEALADALHEVEETHATREPSDGERRHLMGIVTRATREIEYAVRALRAVREKGGVSITTLRYNDDVTVKASDDARGLDAYGLTEQEARTNLDALRRVDDEHRAVRDGGSDA